MTAIAMTPTAQPTANQVEFEKHPALVKVLDLISGILDNHHDGGNYVAEWEDTQYTQGLSIYNPQAHHFSGIIMQDIMAAITREDILHLGVYWIIETATVKGEYGEYQTPCVTFYRMK